MKTTTYVNDSFKRRVVEKSGVCGTLRARDYKDPKCVQVAQIYPNSGNPQAGRVYDSDGILPCIGSCTGGNRQPKISIPEKTKKSNVWLSEKGVKYILSPKRGMCTDVNADVIQPLTAKGQSNWTGSFVSPDIETLEKDTVIGRTEPVKIKLKNGENITSDGDTSKLHIRKLTPKECFRFMGFTDAEFDRAEKVNSNTQLYKQAGNSIVVDVLIEIFKSILTQNIL